jgi:hypothetical protein
MRKLQRVAVAAAHAAGLGVAGTAASATTAAPAHRTPAGFRTGRATTAARWPSWSSRTGCSGLLSGRSGT